MTGNHRPAARRPAAAALAAISILAAGAARAVDRQDPLPKGLEGVGVDEKLDAAVPLDLVFNDERGNEVRLGDYFHAGKPVVLTLNYYRCPMLCTLVLNGYVDAVKALGWVPGREFESITVSIDPRELPTLAQSKKQSYIESLGAPEAGAGWHFLTGREPSIQAVANAVGFRYRYVEETDQFAHTAAIFVLTPDGRVSRYLYGVMFDPKTLRLALVEASRGKIGTTLDQLILYCYHYDPSTGTYAPAAMKIMRAGSLLTGIVFALVLSMLWLREWRRRQVA